MISFLTHYLPPYLRALRAQDGVTLSRLHARVGLMDMDINRHMNHTVYARWMDIGKMDLLTGSGAWASWKARGVRSAVQAHNRLTFRRGLGYGAAFVVDSRATAVEGRVLITSHTFLVGDAVYAKGSIGTLLLGDEGVLDAAAVAELARGLLSAPLDIEGWALREEGHHARA